MTVLDSFDLDDDGKIDLSGVYGQADPRSYYQTLVTLEYRIPESASSLFGRILGALRATREQNSATILDVGCSYGVNSALLKHGYGLSELFNLYNRQATAGLSHQQLIDRDRGLFQSDNEPDIQTVGLDTSDEAIAYACEANILDAGIVADFESRDPTAAEAALVAPTDLVISTGAIGYVGAPTFTRILDSATRAPWMALFALRMFPIDEIADMLKARGYAVYHLKGQTFRQRRFAGRDEREEVLAKLASLGIDPTGHEANGWYHAEFFLALPPGETDDPPIINPVRL